MIDCQPLPQKTREDVLQLVAEALGLAPDHLQDDSTAGDFAEWDSMGTLAILASLAREGIHLDFGEAMQLGSMEGIFQLFQTAGRLA